jgi:transcriptional regulator NrdR family protein
VNHTTRIAALSDENGDLIRAPCPACRASTSGVTNTRAWHGIVRRRRKCRACEHRWSTLEIPSELAASLPLMEENLRRVSRTAAEMADALNAITALMPAKSEG